MTSSFSKTSVFVRPHVNEKLAFSKIFSLENVFEKITFSVTKKNLRFQTKTDTCGRGQIMQYFQRMCNLLVFVIKGLFTWSGGPRSSGVGFFCFHPLGDTKQKKPSPLDRGTPLHVNRV